MELLEVLWLIRLLRVRRVVINHEHLLLVALALAVSFFTFAMRFAPGTVRTMAAMLNMTVLATVSP